VENCFGRGYGLVRLRDDGDDTENTLHANTNKKVKFSLVQALRLYTGRIAHRGSRGIAILFHDHFTTGG
jgi:hypothetical protein